MRTNADCTLYTRDVYGGSESWTRKPIVGVFWENRKAANVLRSGMLEADGVTVYIPQARGDFGITPGDVLVKGLVGDVINTTFTMTDLKAKYADVVTVRTVDRKDFGSQAMRHWQIGAS